MRFRSSGSEEIYYVAEQKDRQYVLVVDVNKMGSDFGQESGTYDMVSDVCKCAVLHVYYITCFVQYIFVVPCGWGLLHSEPTAVVYGRAWLHLCLILC